VQNAELHKRIDAATYYVESAQLYSYSAQDIGRLYAKHLCEIAATVCVRT
jgi:hypothetical protein